jgi:uncharacterized repeat protein (TIGR03803 family)
VSRVLNQFAIYRWTDHMKYRFVLPVLLGLSASSMAQASNDVNFDYTFPQGGPVSLLHGDLVEGADGSFYGTSVFGADNLGTGTVFRMAPDHTTTIVHTFSLADSNNANTGGAYPQAGVVIGPDGSLYGTTVFGGSHGAGVIYRIQNPSSASSSLSVIHEFDAIDDNNINTGGAEPYAALIIGPDGNFYGTTYYGGSNGGGTIFKITPAGELTTLHELGSSTNLSDNGAHPEFRLTLGPDGNFYGTTINGGSGNGFGTLFRMTPDGSFTTLHTFGPDPLGGMTPTTVSFGRDGALYGLTEIGGAFYPQVSGFGLIYRYSDAAGFEQLYSFSDERGGGGSGPLRSALVQAADGSWYGTRGMGVASDVIYRFVPGVSYEMVYAFGDAGNEEDIPETTLLMGSDGKFHGTTTGGPNDGMGGIYSFTPNISGPVNVSMTPSQITVGQSATLSWSADEFTGCYSYRDWQGLNQATSGQLTLTPQQPGTYYYELACNDNLTNAQIGDKTVMLTVLPAGSGGSGTGSGGSAAASSGGGGAFDLETLGFVSLLLGARAIGRRRPLKLG